MTNKIKSLIICFCLLFACQAPNTSPSHDKKADQSSVKDTLQFDSTYNYVNLIPDSLRTPEQKRFLRQLVIVAAKYIKIQNNHMVFTISREQLVAQGIPSPYYDVIQKNLRDNNAEFDKNNVTDLDSMWQHILLKIKDSLDDGM